ncbi:hypothetical protein AB0O37_05420, partial [Microbacterium chocolatum]
PNIRWCPTTRTRCSASGAQPQYRWCSEDLILTEPKKNGKQRAVGTVRSYKSKVDGYLIPEFGDLPVREIDAERIRLLTLRLDSIPSPLNPRSKFNGVTRPVLTVLLMLLRQAARDGVIPAVPTVTLPRQEAPHGTLILEV